ncbi:hypothetical protein, partial [Aeromicrobium alkaliterrae]
METSQRWERRARIGALSTAAALPLMELSRVAALLDHRSLLIAAVATAVVTPLHLRHVAAALRGASATHGRWTLALMAVVALWTAAMLGTVYVFSLASLVVSCFLVLRPPWSYAAASGVVAAGLAVEILGLGPESAQVGNWVYVSVALMFRATAQLVIIAFATMLHELSSTRDELAESAVIGHRDSVEHHLRDVLIEPMSDLALRVDRVRDALDEPDPVPAVEIVDISRRSRELLAKTREVVAGYRGHDDHAQLQAAGHLLRGAEAPAVVPPPASPLEDVASTRRRALTLLAIVQIPVAAFLLGVPSGLFADPATFSTPSWPWLASTATTVALGCWAVFDGAEQRTSPTVRARFGILLAVLLVSVLVLADDPVDASLGLWLVLPAAAFALRARTRSLVIAGLVTATVILWVVASTQIYALPPVEMFWFFAYIPLVTV